MRSVAAGLAGQTATPFENIHIRCNDTISQREPRTASHRIAETSRSWLSAFRFSFLEFMGTMMRRLLLALSLIGSGAFAAETAIAATPNFLIIIADDLGYGDVSVYHPSDVQTPRLEQLAREGMLFTSMRANCTVCSPSRAALLSGRYPDRAGVPGVIRTFADNSWGWFDPGIPTLADALKQAGYHTAIVGKWHLGLESPNLPNERGFDFFHGFLGDMMDSYTTHLRQGHNYMRLNAEVIEPVGHATELFADWAIDYLQRRKNHPDQPFFLYLAFNAPHFPIEPPEEFLARVKARAPQLNDARARNVALVEHLDSQMGRVLDALRNFGLEENTLVVFTSDNGGSLPHAQNNDPWRDGKQSHYDGGLRIPFVVRWPAGIKAGSQTAYAGLNFDLFPTFLELAAAPVPAGLDAISLVEILRGGTISDTRDLYFVRREGGPAYGGKSYEALIRGEWKLMQNDPYSPLELYHLKNDPQEQHNVIESHPKLVRELGAALRKQIQAGGAVPWQQPAAPTTPTNPKSPAKTGERPNSKK
jgi:arylsulfatase A-like enzyme